MSRVAKMPVLIPAKVEVKINLDDIKITGPKGTEAFTKHKLVNVLNDSNQLSFEPADDSDFADAIAGTTRAIINNMVVGVTNGFERKLILVGVGYRAQAQGKKLNLALGYSHPIVFDIPDGIVLETPSNTEIIVKGTNKQKVGQVAANIRSYRKPEPYKGKGVRYSDEVIILKETKKK